jgi:hypothetical protein
MIGNYLEMLFIYFMMIFLIILAISKVNYKFVETFDENKYDYKTKIVHNEFYPNEFYPDEFDLEPIEKFERKDIVSKYDLIIQLVGKQNNLNN